MRELNLEVASEFLLMAATLVYIKSKMLSRRGKSSGPSAGRGRPKLPLRVKSF